MYKVGTENWWTEWLLIEIFFREEGWYDELLTDLLMLACS